MGRVYDTVFTKGKSLHTLFDSGALHNYITKKSAEGLTVESIHRPSEVGLGGETKSITEVCFIVGELQSNELYFPAAVIKDLGMDEYGREIDLLFGALSMQLWNIKIDPEKEKLDLSKFRREFIEYWETEGTIKTWQRNLSERGSL